MAVMLILWEGLKFLTAASGISLLPRGYEAFHLSFKEPWGRVSKMVTKSSWGDVRHSWSLCPGVWKEREVEGVSLFFFAREWFLLKSWMSEKSVWVEQGWLQERNVLELKWHRINLRMTVGITVEGGIGLWDGTQNRHGGKGSREKKASRNRGQSSSKKAYKQLRPTLSPCHQHHVGISSGTIRVNMFLEKHDKTGFGK